jgi:predicted transcriptional regulator
VLAVLQAAQQPLTAAQALERLGGALSYSTVVTILTRLFDKGALTRTKHGRAFAYTPATDSPGLTARHMHQVMANNPDRRAVLARFLDDLSTSDEQLLRQLLPPDE